MFEEDHRGESASGVSESARKSFDDWIREQVMERNDWFQRIRLSPDLVTPGWSDPEVEKLPHFGLPDDLTGLRVLDIGCSEGYFSFEAERRGAAEVIAIDSSPDSITRFNICRNALRSNANAYLCNVYDISPRTFGTFDLVLYYGVLYHLRHPLLSLEKVLSVCTGTMLLQCAVYGEFEQPGLKEQPMARFYAHGRDSGPDAEGNPLLDPTIFWVPNRECVRAMTDCAGFVGIETISENDFVSIVLRAKSPVQEKGQGPDLMTAPWS